MRIENLSIPMLIASVILSIVAPSKPSQGGHWEYDSEYDMAFYVYETRESATFEGEEGGVAYFRTDDGNVWGAYVYESDLVDGETVTLTFENRVPKQEYDRALDTGETREDSGQVVAIDR